MSSVRYEKLKNELVTVNNSEQRGRAVETKYYIVNKLDRIISIMRFFNLHFF